MAIPSSRRREIRDIQDVYSRALRDLGIQVVAESLSLWGDVPADPKRLARALNRYLDQIVKVTGLRRSHARQLALPYYRLVRALETGYTIQPMSVGDDGKVTVGKGSTTSMDDLRKDFYDTVNLLTPQSMESKPRASRKLEGDDKVKIEKLDGIADDLNGLEDQQSSILDSNVRTHNAMTHRHMTMVKATKREAQVVDSEREDALTKGGARTASVVERSTLDGGRETVDQITEKDHRAIGWIRYSTTGTPCGFCAMLIARSVQLKAGGGIKAGWLYNSAKTAIAKADGQKYHDNCHCESIPVYSEQEILTDPRFALNRQYAQMWPQVTKGLSGKGALAAWRKHFRDTQKVSTQRHGPLAQA